MAAAQSVNIKAAASTLVVHVLLFLLFIFIGYAAPPVSPPAEELGMEVNLGTSDDGSGDDQPLSVDASATLAANTTYKAAASQSEDGKNMMQSDDPEAPSIATPATTTNARSNTQPVNNNRSRPQQTETASNNNPQQQRPRYVYNGAAGRGGNSAVANRPGTTEGNTAGPGDRGVPGGTPGAANYTGSPGNGTGGVSHNLTGRDISPKQFMAEFNEGGRVVVLVKVDRDGNIISKSIKSSPNKRLSDIALQKLSQARFSKDTDAAPEQIGKITFVFKTRSQE